MIDRQHLFLNAVASIFAGKSFAGKSRRRGAGAVAVCVGLALLVGGCDPTRDARYFREGIGTDLYWDGLPAATQLQDIYLANICAQAISPTARSIDSSCDGLPLSTRNWGLLVQAGMNDIDLRCDGYLAWLYDRKSSKEPFLKELAAVGGAAAGILSTTHAGPTPIALTAIAFGLAADTFTNVDQRLVNAVDYTTVDSVVRDNRTKFRGANLDLVIDNRPAAIYILRQYLSICVPDAIEMSINNTVIVYHRGGPDALRTAPVGLRSAPATGGNSATIGTGVPLTSGSKIGKPDRPQPPVDKLDLSTIVEDPSQPSIVGKTDFIQVQRALCVPASEEGTIGPFTRGNIQIFEVATYARKDNPRLDGKLDTTEVLTIKGTGPCQGNPKPRNYYEKAKGAGVLATLIGLLKNVDPTFQPANVSSVNDVRQEIKLARSKVNQSLLQSYPFDVSDELTFDLMSALAAVPPVASAAPPPAVPPASPR